MFPLLFEAQVNDDGTHVLIGQEQFAAGDRVLKGLYEEIDVDVDCAASKLFGGIDSQRIALFFVCRVKWRAVVSLGRYRFRFRSLLNSGA